LQQLEVLIKINGRETDQLFKKSLKKVMLILYLNINKVQKLNNKELYMIKTVKDLELIDISLFKEKIL
jgi:hypothetical protein